MSSSDRGLINGFKEITSMADRIHVAESIVEHAKSLFKQVHDKKNLKGQAIVVTAAACLHIACRLSNASHTFKVCWLSVRTLFFS
jgi:transcription initiation factor TFIIB